MQGKTIVVTGGTSGIGEVAALTLASQGYRIVLVARDKARGEATLSRLEEIGAGRGHQIHYGDLAQLSEMKRVAAEIAAAEPEIDVLINNAGAMFANREVTKDGFERTFALNHLSYFVMTAGLRARFWRRPPRGSSIPRLMRTRARISTSTICRPRKIIRALRPMAARSSPIFCSRANWRTVSKARL